MTAGSTAGDVRTHVTQMSRGPVLCSPDMASDEAFCSSAHSPVLVVHVPREPCSRPALCCPAGGHHPAVPASKRLLTDNTSNILVGHCSVQRLRCRLTASGAMLMLWCGSAEFQADALPTQELCLWQIGQGAFQPAHLSVKRLLWAAAANGNAAPPGGAAGLECSPWLRAVLLRGLCNRASGSLSQPQLCPSRCCRSPSLGAILSCACPGVGRGSRWQPLPGAALPISSCSLCIHGS